MSYLDSQTIPDLQCPLESMKWVDSQDRHKYYAANFAGKADRHGQPEDLTQQLDV